MTTERPGLHVSGGARIGVDFDNTIIRYDDVFLNAAKARGLLPDTFVGTKKAVRDEIRRQADGELEWQKLQSYVYSRGIEQAQPFDGLESFLVRSRETGCEVVIVSHKTEFGHFDPCRISLRAAATGWLERRGYFQARIGLNPHSVFFEDTRAAKIERIKALQCAYFIDDLEEVFAEPAFPADVRRILFATQCSGDSLQFDAICPTWTDIGLVLFNGR